MTWEIALGIFALITFGIAVVTPIIKLNTLVTKLNSSIEYLSKMIDKHDIEIHDLREKTK